MYDIEATVTKSTPSELKLTGNWPLDWLQAPEKSTEVIAELLPGQTEPPPSGPVQRLEILGNRALRPNLQLGDRVVVTFPIFDVSVSRVAIAMV
jgi:hypothetical protein